MYAFIVTLVIEFAIIPVAPMLSAVILVPVMLVAKIVSIDAADDPKLIGPLITKFAPLWVNEVSFAPSLKTSVLLTIALFSEMDNTFAPVPFVFVGLNTND